VAAKPQGCSGLSITPDLFALLSKDPEKLFGLQPRQFEELVAEILASYGWRVQLTAATRDGGYDIFAISRDASGLETSWLVECKKYRRGRKVGLELVRSLLGTRAVVPGGMLLVATTSHFSRDAIAFKESRYDLQFKDYEAILEWINSYRPNPTGELYIKNSQLVLSSLNSELTRLSAARKKRFPGAK
jgi:restriction endonuclease Mrr